MQITMYATVRCRGISAGLRSAATPVSKDVRSAREL
jgi:hypothetical protein